MAHTPDPGAAVAGVFGFVLFFWIAAIALGLALTVFWIVELVDVARREFPDQNTKILWVLVVLFSHTIGALVYYFAGKSQGWLPGEQPLSPPGQYRS